MTTLMTKDVGRVWTPGPETFVVGPATPAGLRRRRYEGIVTYVVRDGSTGKITQRGWGYGIAQEEGLWQRWHEDEALQQQFQTPEAYIACVRLRTLYGRDPLQMAHAANERIENGARMLAKSFWGLSSSPQVSTVNAPSFMALNNNSSFTSANFTWAHCGTDLSLGNGSSATAAGITTNEFTNHGLSRASATIGSYADPSALDGVFTCTVVHTFTETTGPDTGYGMGLFDAASTATCNLFMESSLTSFTVQTNDTITPTVNVSD